MLAVTTTLPILGLTGCVLAAARSDAHELRIPNALSAAILALFGVYAAVALTPQAAAVALGLAASTLLLGFIAYRRGLMGGGDAKLLAACMAWAGPAYALEFLAVTAIAGGVIALALVSPLTARAAVAMQRNWPARAVGAKASMPYGVAIAAGALVVVVELLGA